MDIDLDNLANVLNDTTRQIQEASEKVKENPLALASFAQPIMENFTKLQELGNIKDLNKTTGSPDTLHTAIKGFLSQAEIVKASALGATIFKIAEVQELNANLQQVKEVLKRGKKVDPKDESGI